MSKVNKRWAKWIFASVSKFFFLAAQDEGVHMHIEGFKRETNDKSQWLEFRMEGPRFAELSRNCWRVELDIDIGVNHTKDDSQYHGLVLLQGIAESLFDSCIPVFKRRTKGVTDSESDNTFWIGLSLQNSQPNRPLNTTFFGMPTPSTNIEQASVEGQYAQTFSLTP